MPAIAVARYAAGRYAQAIERPLEAQRLRPGFQGSRRLPCASLAQTGRIDEAKSLLATIGTRAIYLAMFGVLTTWEVATRSHPLQSSPARRRPPE